MPADYIVRYGATRTVAEFHYKGELAINRSTAVLVRSDRGVEWGEVLCPATDRTREYLGKSDQAGRILRPADGDAWKKLDELHLSEREVFEGGKAAIREHKLNMQLVDVEKVFGGERIVFYYLAEQRVDFRELVKVLARQFQSRIEMRQIGVRDEARLLADYGDCGKPVCCGTHLREMPPVSMKMAKMQKATLDPNKISGRCGRLKCCLRYEFDTYEEYRRELPKAGAIVLTKQGQGKVLAQEILARKVLVSFEDGRRTLVDLADIVTVVSAGGGSRKKDKPDQPTSGGGDPAAKGKESPRSDSPKVESKSPSDASPAKADGTSPSGAGTSDGNAPSQS
ncbi:MAG: regulatory iron-sulfur-containing complex subunit RicT [Planctomycetota bacterium]|nr:regulatory iron-sulfur-containing complex subunit RicT [Planctomycetota bacterium]